MLNSYRAPFYFPPADRRSSQLPEDFPEYIVYMTREALKSMTSSMQRVYSGAEDYLFHVNQWLAYERSFRALQSWGVPAPMPWIAAMPQSWTGYSPQQSGLAFFPGQLNPGTSFFSVPVIAPATRAFSPGAYAFAPFTSNAPIPYTTMIPLPALWGFTPSFPKFVPHK